MSTTANRTNMYEIQEYWLANIAPKYFDMTDVSLNRAGFFGYVNEIESHSVESVVNENSILYNELFFKRAQIPETIYAYAAQHEVANTTATAAVMNYAIVVNESMILDNCIKNDSADYFIIDSDSEIILENKITYSLDYDIRLNIRKAADGTYSYTARYVTTDLGNPISSITSTSNPYLKVAKIKYSSLTYLIIYVSVHQVTKTVKNKVIYSDNIIDYFNFDIETGSTDMIADFAVYYRSPSETQFNQIQKILIDKEAIDNDFCYYQFKDNNLSNVVNISFSSISRYFQPEFNSELKFVFYNTLGGDGTFEYTGSNTTISLKSSVYDYSEVVMTIYPIGDSVGGVDALSYDKIKEQVSIMSSTASVIATESDLNKYFANLEMQSKVIFVKKEDDVMRRMFGAYTMFRDKYDNIIPSNSLDIDLYDADFDLIEESTKRYVLKAGNEFIYQPNSRRLSKLTDRDSLLFEPSFIYKNPFTIIINRSEFFTTYYLTSINKIYSAYYSIINEDLYLNFIMNNVTIKRNSLESNTYEINFSVTPATDETDVLFANLSSDGTFMSDNNEMIIKGMIYSDDTTMSHYFDCVMTGCTSNDTTAQNIFSSDTNANSSSESSTIMTYNFKAQLKTDDYISIYSHLRMTDGVYDANDHTKKNPLIPATELLIKFGIFLKDTKDTSSDVYHNHIIGLDGYSMTNVFTLADTVPLITDMNRLMYSTVLYKYDDNNDLYYRVKEVPVIKSEYLSISSLAMAFYQNFASDYTVFMSQLKKVTNAFDISIKMYNTYGKSYYFYVNGKESNTLDEVNLKIAFKIKLNPNKLSDSLLKASIILAVKKYIEDINDIDDLDLYISNIITELETTYTDIISTVFKYMNNYTAEVQSVQKNFPSSDYIDRALIYEFVPEYLNINKTYIDATTANGDVLIEFV